MEFVAVLIMIAAGAAIAFSIAAAVTFAREERDRRGAPSAAPDKGDIATSLLCSVIVSGAMSERDALRLIHAAGFAGEMTPSIDIATWADAYAQMTTPSEREHLLESAVGLVSEAGKLVSLVQYAALLDLTFGLGFRPDALAKLRESYPFDYVDHARDARPRYADRTGRTTLFKRAEGDSEEWLRLLEIEGQPTRQAIAAAYRRKAAQHHPDRFHGQTPEIREAAAARFIEITRAYEALLAAYGD